MRHRPNAHATISGNSSRQNAPSCDPARSFMTAFAAASRSASAHLLAFSRKNGSCAPATSLVRGSGLSKMPGACNRCQVRRTRRYRRLVDAEAQERGPALHPPRREHRVASSGQRHAKPPLRPSANVLDQRGFDARIGRIQQKCELRKSDRGQKFHLIRNRG